MTWKAFFIVERDLYYKFYSPWITCLTDRGWQVTICHYYSRALGTHGKAYSLPKAGYAPESFEKGKLVYAGSCKELAATITEEQPEFIFSLHFTNEYPAVVTGGSRWVTLQHWADSLDSVSRLREPICDFFICYDAIWLESCAKFFPVKSVALFSHIPFIGRSKPYHSRYYGVDKNRYLLYFPVGNYRSVMKNPLLKLWYEIIFCTNSIWLSVFLSKLNFLTRFFLTELFLFSKLREFCDRNDLELVVKGRLKRMPGLTCLDMADKSFVDEAFSPATTDTLIMDAEVVVTHFSMAAIEASAMEKPVINIGIRAFGDQPGLFISRYLPSWVMEVMQSNGRGFGYCEASELGSYLAKFADVSDLKNRLGAVSHKYLEHFRPSDQYDLVKIVGSLEQEVDLNG